MSYKEIERIFSICLHIYHFLVFLGCLSVDLNFCLVSPSLKKRTSFSVCCCRTDGSVTSSLSSHAPENASTALLFSKDIFSEYRIMG